MMKIDSYKVGMKYVNPSFNCERGSKCCFSEDIECRNNINRIIISKLEYESSRRFWGEGRENNRRYYFQVQYKEIEDDQILTKDKNKDRRLKRTYGVDLKWFNDRAKNGCEVCGRTEGRLCVDHVHIKGFKKLPPEEKKKYVRGVCCFMCNTAFKAFEKTVDGERNRKQLENTVKYFKKYPLKGEV